jgi:hypothetical protein
VVGLALSDYLADRRGLVKPYQPKRRPTDAADAQGPNGDGTGVEDLEGANEERPGPVKALTWKAPTRNGPAGEGSDLEGSDLEGSDLEGSDAERPGRKARLGRPCPGRFQW